nr:hypothetical protein [Tanacetum cinerariifolium]
MFSLEIKGMEEEECLEEDDSNMIEYELSETPHISLNALSRVPTHNTMRVKGYSATLHLMQCSEGHDSSLNEELNQLLEEYADVFIMPKELPPYKSFDHKILIKTDNVSINIRPYRFPPTQKNTIETMIKELLDSRIVGPCNSPFSSPIVLELIDELHGAMVFPKLNLRSGYHQIRMCEDDIYKTAFKSHEGYYEFVVMPFGLTNAPSTFQALMNSVFKPFLRTFTLVFFDDILKSKCVFGTTQVEYLGHVISAQGVSTDLSKITTMQDWPVPTTLKQLRGFLGLTGYYRRFIKEEFVIETDASRISIGAKGVDNATADALSRIERQVELFSLLAGTLNELLDAVIVTWSTDHVLKEIVERLKTNTSQTSNGKSALLVVVDRLSKFAHFLPITHPYTASQVAKLLLDNVYKLHGLPNTIVSDRDKIFMSLFWQSLFKMLQVKLKFSTAYHPQTDEQTEIVNKCLETYLRCMTREKSRDWVKWISLAEY